MGGIQKQNFFCETELLSLCDGFLESKSLLWAVGPNSSEALKLLFGKSTDLQNHNTNPPFHG